MAEKHNYAVILSGGTGTRFWPLSRASAPKQLLKMAGADTLLEATIKRLSPLIAPECISIVTNSTQAELTRLHLSERVKKMPGFVVEPMGRNTAPAIGLAAIELLKKDPDAVMAVLPSDHLIGNKKAFQKTLQAAFEVARLGYFVTFGIKPDRPETGYGYIKAAPRAFKKVGGIKARKVVRFVEKPDLKRAKRFLKDGGFFWNSGIFVWRAQDVLDAIGEHLPKVHKELLAIRDGAEIEKAYSRMTGISIDHGVLEKVGNVALIEAGFTWSDMGSLNSMDEIFKADRDGNIKQGRVVDIESEGSFIIGSDRVVATIGLKDMLVIDTPDATLVCPKDRAQDVKQTVEVLKKKGYIEHAEHLTVERPWGTYTVLEKGDGYKLKKICVLPGKRLSLQSHSHRSEHWVVISGRARVTRGEEVVVIKTNESTYIPKGVRHRLANPSRMLPLEIIEVQSGAYVEEDDITRYKDDFKRG